MTVVLLCEHPECLCKKTGRRTSLPVQLKTSVFLSLRLLQLRVGEQDDVINASSVSPPLHSFTVSDLATDVRSSWRTGCQLWGQKKNQSFNLSDVQSNRRGTCTTSRNNEAFIYCMLRWVGGGKGGRSLMPPNNTPVYSLLGIPSLNTFLTFQELHSIQKKKKSAERDLRRLFSPQRGRETHNDLLRATWDLVKGNNGRIVLASLGSNCCIDAVVLENHCIQWRNSCSECF